MGDARFLTGLLLVGLAAIAVLFVLVAAGFTRPGPRRPGLVAGGLPLALLPAALATAFASWQLLRVFADMRPDSSARELGAAFDALWGVQRLGWGATLGLCLVGAILGLCRFGGSTGDVACSLRRASTLLLLPVLAVAAVGLAQRPLVGALRVGGALALSNAGGPGAEDRLAPVLAAEGLQSRGSGAIGAAARYVSRAPVAGAFAGATAAVVLTGLALPGLVLAWRVRFGASFSALALLAWVAAGTIAGLAAFGVFDPLRAVAAG